MRISIIIPIYKAENAIERCARSLMEQTIVEDIEYIFINDCSPDDSIGVLKQCLSCYPNRKQQVTILNNDSNVGPLGTRKRGVSVAKGMYLGFCDADDWVEPTMYESLLNASEGGEKDIVVSDYYCEKTDGQEIFNILSFSSPHDALSHMDDWHQFSNAMWNQIVRKSILEEQINYICPTKFREDTFLMMRCYYHADSIAFVGKPFYHYNLIMDNSLIHSRDMTQKGWFEQKENMDRIASLLLSNRYGCDRFARAINCFKFALKLEYKDSFPSMRDYYYAYRESHSDGIRKESTNVPFINKLMLNLVYNTNYFLFRLLIK